MTAWSAPEAALSPAPIRQSPLGLGTCEPRKPGETFNADILKVAARTDRRAEIAENPHGAPRKGQTVTMTTQLLDRPLVRQARPPVTAGRIQTPESVNVELARGALEGIRLYPDAWDQTTWNSARIRELATPVPGLMLAVCQTVMCYAGHVAVRAGAELPTRIPPGSWWVDTGTGAAHSHGASGRLPVAVFAARKLGVTEDQARDLFASGNTLPRLARMLDRLATSGQGAYLGDLSLYHCTDCGRVHGTERA